ncbi:MAG: gliding motility-associated C-terminal domain-containing protein, partial [Saprospiraceae bacterium]|nr:gliding motility-associated C-terminal domain-containing protein [Saprospiraceae bacterium]
DQFVVSVDEFRIFDRWGELVFEAETPHEPNNSKYGWEGDFNDTPAEQGVYVYSIKVTYDNGESELFIGDITLVR